MSAVENIVNLIPSILMIVAPLLIAALGGMICERSGVVNIALEGLMSVGAMTAATVHVLLEASTGFSIPLALILAAGVGLLFSLIHAFASITLRANQVVSGTGINLLANGITVFFCQVLFAQKRTASFKMGMQSFWGLYPTVWIAFILLFLCWYVLYKRPWGLRLRAAGEHPSALASAGVNVLRIRYIAVLISGALAGLAGACIVLTQTTEYAVNTINGKGFIALAAVSFGRWVPLGILGSSLLFGTASAMAVYIVGSVDSHTFLTSDFFSALPYLITLVTLVIFSGKDYAPRASGEPYDKGK
ncbi:ABC transporter permease [Breznakiellaceae bacterium SP9]